MLKNYVEKRVEEALEERGYTDLILAGIDATVAGTAGDVLRTGAVETCAGMWGRVLAGADVSLPAVLTPQVRDMIGRCLIRDGELVFVIDVIGGRQVLIPASHFEVLESHRYKVTTERPPGDSVTRIHPRDRILHFTWSIDPREPWRGISPMGRATLLAKIAAGIDTKLVEELATPTAHILPIPGDGASATLDGLRADVAGAKGAAIVLPSTTAAPYDDEGMRGTRKEWEAKRLGPMIPSEMRTLWQDVLEQVGQASGIPPSLFRNNADGTSQREAYRRWIMASVEPVAEGIAMEASLRLEEEVAFDFTRLWAHDLAGRAKAFQSLTAAGIEADRAMRISGLE